MRDRFLRFWLGLVLVCAVVLAVSVALLVGARAEHKPEHMALHHQFYATWMMPDNRAVSCCHDEDCEPAEAYQKDGFWYARKISEVYEHPEYTKIPPQKVETERDSPDGQSHICGRRYNGFAGPGMSVFCFVPGNGS